MVVPNQALADELRGMEKKKVDNTLYTFPAYGEELQIPIISVNHDGHKFRYIINRKDGKHKTHKRAYLKNYEYETDGYLVLVRLDVNSVHTNPVDVPAGKPWLSQYRNMYFDGPHLHLYIENDDLKRVDKWAVPVPEDFNDLENIFDTHLEFLDYNVVVDKPNVQAQKTLEGGIR